MTSVDRWRKRCLVWMFVAILCGLVRGQNPAPVLESEHGPNAPGQEKKPYVVLVSLDGFRYDYTERYGAKNLHALATQGASAPEGMIPVYPSLTFPNHYSIVTGLYPEHHGIVAMSFYDPKRKQRYAFNDPSTNSDGSWYGGVPLWSLAEKQGMRSACFFWPGSEAEIAGERPSYYLHFDDHFPDEARIQQVVAWLRLSSMKRPHFITLYYSNVDHAGHEFGPDSPQTEEAVRHVDDLVGMLEAKLKELDLPIDLFVVSDHGMENIAGNWIDLDHFADLSAFQTEGMLLYSSSESDAEKAYEHLKGASNKFVVYRRRRRSEESALRPERARGRSGGGCKRGLMQFALMRRIRRIRCRRTRAGTATTRNSSKPCAPFSTPSAPIYGRTRRSRRLRT